MSELVNMFASANTCVHLVNVYESMPGDNYDLAEAFNEHLDWVADVGTHADHVKVIDWNNALTIIQGQQALDPDGIHPNPLGQEYLAWLVGDSISDGCS